MIADGLRLYLVQILLQDVANIGPLSVLYYVGPWCFIFLFIPFLRFEVGVIKDSSEDYTSLIPTLLINAATAFGKLIWSFTRSWLRAATRYLFGLCDAGLNLSLFLVLGKLSPTSMKIIGGFKDCLLIVLSLLLGL